MEQSVRPNETHCSTRRNKPFCVLKQAVILGGNKKKAVFSCLFLISLDTFFLYKRH